MGSGLDRGHHKLAQTAFHGEMRRTRFVLGKLFFLIFFLTILIKVLIGVTGTLLSYAIAVPAVPSCSV